MNLIALKMLIGDKAKYLGLIFGIAFASLLMSHQLSIFIGLMQRTANLIEDAREADIWVMDKRVDYIDGVEPISDIFLSRVKSVSGVEWATAYYKGQIVARIDNFLQTATIVGFDPNSLVGAPRKMILGKLEDAKRPNAIIIDKVGYNYIWPNQPLKIGQIIEANDRRMVVVGICDSSPAFSLPVIIFATYQNATQYTGNSRNKMSFILVKARNGENKSEVIRKIEEETGLKAKTWSDFKSNTISYYLTHTGIPINFGITVTLGFIIGAVISGQTFYIFIVENLKQFGALKAIGVNNSKIFLMVLTQAATVSSIGFSIGIGLTSLFFQKFSNTNPAFKGFIVHWQVVAITAVAVALIMLITSILSIRKVFVIDPAIVFRG